MDALMELVGAVRTLRAEYDVPPAARVEVHLGHVAAPLRAALDAEGRALARLARVDDARTDGAVAKRAAHAVLSDGTELTLPLEGVIDLERERARLGAERDRLDAQLRATEARLGNEQFTSKAPAEVVQREREKAGSFREQIERLRRKLDALA